ncbi:hypothetical protein O181_051256 [Austropuccinia psidii MF-1]|uniref:Uncharacterized protein n=1 Tax=Austropuccinia psidii MF-1 TaxID=1389203 RepID=A0A9Q3HN61_9BASI|nr:hypothetical protein [Austropuccinia psidii MF-1]
MNSWHILKTFLTEEEIVVYSNGWYPLSSKPQIKRIKEYHSKNREASKEEAQKLLPASLKPTNLCKKGIRTRKRIEGNHIPQATGFKNLKTMPWTMSSTWPEL